MTRHKSPPLTDEQKEAVLELWTVKRLSMKSIASIMGVSISVIHRTIRREELLR